MDEPTLERGTGTAHPTHAVLGGGGVGGLLAAVLARSGRDVTLLARSAEQPSVIEVDSAVLGNFTAKVTVATQLDHEVDFLWVAVKAPQLREAIEKARRSLIRRTVIPLLNGIDHVGALENAYDNVTTGAIGVESARVAPGRIVQPQPFLWVHLAGPFAEDACSELGAAGINCRVKDDAKSVLWSKLIMLAPLALTTTALQAPLESVRDDPRWRSLLLAAIDEATAVARAEGAHVDPEFTKSALLAAPGSFRSSMQKDREAGRPLELEHVAGAVTRRGRLHGIPTPAFDELSELLEPVAAGAGAASSPA